MRNRQGPGRGDPQAHSGRQGITPGAVAAMFRTGIARFRMRNLPQSRDMTGPRTPHAAAPFGAPPAFARSAAPPIAARSRSRRQQPTRSFLNAA